MMLTAGSDRGLEIKYYILDYAQNPFQTCKMNNQMRSRKR